MKKAWVSEAKAFYLDHVQDFPEMPKHLPKRMYEHAYPAANHVCVTLLGINTIADSIPLRSNSKLIKGAKSRSEAAVLEDAYAGGGHTTFNMPLTTFQMHFKGLPLKGNSSAPSRVKAEPVAAVKHEIKHAADDDSDNDPDVIVLKKEFEFRLAQLKASKRARVDAQPVTCEGSNGRLTISRTSTGGLQVNQTVKSENQTVKSEPARPAEPDADDESDDDEPADATSPKLTDLDPWTQAALKALNARNQTKQDLKKRPAAAPNNKVADDKTDKPVSGKKDKVKTEKSAKKVKTEKPVKTSTAKKIKMADDAADVPKSKIMAAMPKSASNASPVRYWGGIIYTAAKARKFRALKVRGDNWSEASAAWGSDKPSKDVWRKCVKAIEDHHAK